MVRIFWPLMNSSTRRHVWRWCAKGGEIGARLGLAVAHAVHGFAAQNFRQEFLLLLRRAEHHQRVGLDRRPAICAAPRRMLHGLHERDLLERRARLWPPKALPASPARSIRLCRYHARIRHRTRAWKTALHRTRPCARPIQCLLQPGCRASSRSSLPAGPRLIGRQGLAAIVEQKRRDAAPRMQRSRHRAQSYRHGRA